MSRLLCCLALLLSAPWSRAAGVTLLEAGLQCSITAISRDSATVQIVNRTPGIITLDQPAGLICATASGEIRIVTLSAFGLQIPTGETVEAQAPIAVLSARADPTGQSFAPVTLDPDLGPLLASPAKPPALPQATAQLVILCLREDVTFAQWQQFLATSRPPAAKSASITPAEIATAIDALTILHTLTPARNFALAADGELKLRALRNPWSRAKAMQLYGLALPEAAAPPMPGAAVAPDLRALLHLSPGDNCPTCRQRTRLQPQDNGL